MVTFAKARGVYTRTRAFYKGGQKSENKGYYLKGAHQGALPQEVEWFRDLTDKQKSRNDNILAVSTLGGAGPTAAERGQSLEVVGGGRYNANITRGNCGMIAAVALYIAIHVEHVVAAEVVHRTAENRNYKSFGSTLTFGHSWLVLGNAAGPRYCVDAWAGVFCDEVEFAREMRAKFALWHQNGKRVAVNWNNIAGMPRRYWTYATDPAIDALLQPNRTVTDLNNLSIIP
jgi:hypothetical protein